MHDMEHVRKIVELCRTRAYQAIMALGGSIIRSLNPHLHS